MQYAPYNLPYISVWTLNLGIMTWYILAGLLRGYLSEHHIVLRIPLYWNETKTGHFQTDPIGLIKMDALHCNGAKMWLSSRFASYAAPFSASNGVGGLHELSDIPLG